MSLIIYNPTRAHTDGCMICRDGLAENAISHETRTGDVASHFFHRPCLNSWLERLHQDRRPTQCPYCQIELENPFVNPAEMTQEALREMVKRRFTEAIRQGRSQDVRELLINEDIDEDCQTESVLQVTEQNEPSIVQVLLIHGNPYYTSRNLSLIIANHAGGDAVIEVLLAHGNLSPLVVATQNNDLIRLRELLVTGNPSRDEQDNSLLLASCKNNDAAVREILRHGNPSKQGQDKALNMAASIGQLDVIRLLTQECHFAIGTYCNAVSSAIEDGRTRIAQVLLENTSQDEKDSVLNFAAERSSTETLQFLLVNYDFSTSAQRTALHSAIIEDRPKAIRFLLEYGTLSQEDQGAALFKGIHGSFRATCRSA